MKKIISILMLALALPMLALAGGRQAVGGTLDYVGKSRSIGVSLFYQNQLTPSLRIAPELGFYARHRDLGAWHADLNVHLPLNLTTGYAEIYPLLGLNYTEWSAHWRDELNDHLSNHTNHYGRLGANIGAGFQLRMSSTLLLKAECKYVLTSKFSTLATSLGVGYVF